MSKLDDPTNPGGDLPPSPNPKAPAATSTPDAPPNELQEWRRRALEAEALVDQLTAALADAQAELESTGRAHTLDALLTDAGAIDLETARALLTARFAQAPDDAPPDLAAIVADLQRAKPFLFIAPPARDPIPPRSAMSPAPPPATPSFDDLDDALELAATTGDRAALLRYLRLRRAV